MRNGNPATENDMIDSNCECHGTISASCDDGIMNGDEEGIDCGGTNCAPCSAPDAVCGLITIYVDPNNPDFDGPSTNNIWLIPSGNLDAGSTSDAVDPVIKVKRYLSNLTFDWTTNGACIDLSPNGGTLSGADKGIIYRDCLPVRNADFNVWKMYQLSISDGFGSDVCVGTFKVKPQIPVYAANSIHFVIPADNEEEYISFNKHGEVSTQNLFEHVQLPEIVVYPNPGNGQFRIQFLSFKDETVNIMISDIDGRLVHKNSYEVLKGENLIVFDLSERNDGIYILRLTSDSWQTTTKWIKG